MEVSVLTNLAPSSSCPSPLERYHRLAFGREDGRGRIITGRKTIIFEP